MVQAISVGVNLRVRPYFNVPCDWMYSDYRMYHDHEGSPMCLPLLYKHGYPPVDRNEVYKEIFEQAENFKKYQTV